MIFPTTCFGSRPPSSGGIRPQHIIIIIIIRHQLGLDKPVSAPSNDLIKGLPNLHCPFGL